MKIGNFLIRMLIICAIILSTLTYTFNIEPTKGNVVYVDPDEYGYALDVTISNDYAYVAYGDAGILIVDVSDPLNPGEPIIIAPPTVIGSIKEIQIIGDTLYYISAWGDTVLGILDISNPINPVKILETPIIVGAANGFHIVDNWAFIASGIFSSDPIPEFGWSVVDISDPSNPILYDLIPTEGRPFDIFISGSYAYVAEMDFEYWNTGTGGMSIFDISVPTNPSFIVRVPTPPTDIVNVKDNQVYLSLYYGGLLRIDVQDPFQPSEPIPIDPVGSARGLCFRNELMFVAGEYSGLTVIDIGNLEYPAYVNNYAVTGYSYDVFISGNYAFIAAGDSGLAIIEIYSVYQPVTEEEIEQAITEGISWLAEQQFWDGSWDWGAGGTAFVLIKLQDRAFELGYDPFDTDSYEYAQNVIDGWQYLLGGIVQDEHGLSIWESVYETGISLMSFAASGMPNRVNMFGHDFNGDGTADTFGEIAQEIVNWLAYAQIDAGPNPDPNPNQGGWGYEANEAGDNSVAGYAVLGLSAAEKFECDIPDFVRNELNIWINNIQDPVDHDPAEGDDGGSWYRLPYTPWVNLLKTGNLIFEMTFYGDDPSTQRFQDAMNYIERHWHDVNLQPGWGYGNSPAHYQAMYCLMKGLDYSGIDLITLDGEEWDWYQEFAAVLVNQQQTGGYWPNSPCYVWPDEWGGGWGAHSGEVLSTVWALLTLEKVSPPTVLPLYIDIKPSSWPNSLNTNNEGVIPVAICGSDDIDVMDIDPTTVSLGIIGIAERVIPLRWSYEDVATPYTGEEGGGHELGGDGILDLVFHFDTQLVVNIFELNDHLGDTIPLIIRGELYEDAGGTILWGQDFVRILSHQEMELVVTIDLSHNSASFYEMSGLEDHLIELGAIVHIIQDSFIIPDGTNVLLIPAARTSYTTVELALIDNWFYSKGSRLLWVAGDSDFEGYFTPDSSNQILASLDASLRISADTVEDYVYNDGLYYQVAVQTPVSDGDINSILTRGVESAIFHGPTSVLGYKDGSIVDLRYEYLANVEIIMQASEKAVFNNLDATTTVFDYYSHHEVNGSYPMMVVEDKEILKDHKYIIASGEVIFSDYKNMYDIITAQGNWNGGRHDGKILVDKVFDWFSANKPLDKLVVTIDKSHYTHAMYETYNFEQHLITQGAIVYTIEESFHIPEYTNVLLIPAASVSYSTEELTLISEWYFNGGPRLIWVAGNSDYGGFFKPDASNDLLASLDAKLRVSADAVEDENYNDGTSYRVAVPIPVYNGELNSIFTAGVESAIFHGPTSVLGYDEGEIVDLRRKLEDVEVIMQASKDAYTVDQDSSNTDYDFYSDAKKDGRYPMIAIEDQFNDKYVIVSGEVIFSDYQHMYDSTTAQGIWNEGYHDGRILVDNIFGWFGSLETLDANIAYDFPTDEYGQRLVVYNHNFMTLDSLSQSYVRHGFSITRDEEYETPVDVQVYFDGEEIQLNQISYAESDVFTYYFYQTFAAGHFEPGIYNWTVVWFSLDEVVWRESFWLTVLDPGHKINVWLHDSMTITTSQRCYVRHGFDLYREEFEEYLPVNVQVFIDGIEIDLQLQYEEDWSDEENPLYLWLFYKDFEQGYFEPGLYNWTVVWYTQQGILLRESFPLTVLEDGHEIFVFDPDTMTISTSERSFVRVSTLPLSREQLDYRHPITIQLFLDGVEIPLQSYNEIDWSDEENPAYFWKGYQSFDAGYFAPGTYEWKVVWSHKGVPVFQQKSSFTVLEDGHKINMFDDSTFQFEASEQSFLRHGFGVTLDELETFDEWLPVNVQVFLNDNEIPCIQYTEIIWEHERPYRWLFYVSFEAGYFIPGETYYLRVIWSDRNGIVLEKEGDLIILSDP